MALAEFGADVAIADKNAEAADEVAGLIRDKGRRAAVAVVDLMDRDQARSAVAATLAALGRIDIVINNVGGTRPIRLIDMTDAQADKQIALNLHSLYAATQAAAKAMIDQGDGGSIVNVTSIEGLRAAPFFSIYAACKAGMINFTRTVALELSEHGIRVNAIAPDLVPTAWMAKMMPGIVSEEGRKAQKKYIPLGRPGNLDDCAGTAVFLASRMAEYVTGVTINVDGGTWASSGWTRSEEAGFTLFG